MYQEDDLILGSGLSQDQSGLAVTAAGFVAGDRPTIFISLIDSSQVFRLKLSVSGEALAGEYDSLSQSEVAPVGNGDGPYNFSSQEESCNNAWQKRQSQCDLRGMGGKGHTEQLANTWRDLRREA